MFRKVQFFLLKRCFAYLEKYEKRYGFHETIKKILALTKTRMHVSGMSPELKITLTTSPTLVVANHPTSASVLALIAALPTRDDIYLFVGAKFYGHSASIDAHLIPAYINNRCQPKNRPYADTLPPEEEHRRNIESVGRAADIINSGGMVLIFPGYPEEPNSRWYRGVGHLIKQVSNRSAHIALVYIREVESLGYVRLVPLLGRILPPITLHFAPLTSIQEIKEEDPKKITADLENKFINMFYDHSAHSSQAAYLAQ